MLTATSNHCDVGNEQSEVLRLARLARAAGYGGSPESALKSIRDAFLLLGDDGDAHVTADLLRWQGSILRERGHTSAAEPLYRRSLEIARRIEYDAGIAHALNCLAALEQRRGNINRAAHLVTDALGLAEQCGDRRLIGILQQNLGMFADIRGNAAAALGHYSVALRTLEAENDAEPIPRLLNNLGVL